MREQLQELEMHISENGRIFYSCSVSDVKNGILDIPLGIVEIADNACTDRKDIITLNLPTGLKKIGKNSFRNNFNMKTPKFPWTLEQIGDTAFYGNNCFTGSLDLRGTKISIGGAGSRAFVNTNINAIFMDEFFSICENTFDGCNKLNKIIANEKTYSYKFVKPFTSNTEEAYNHNFLIDESVSDHIWSRSGLTIYKGMFWCKPRLRKSVFVAEKEHNGEIFTGIGDTSHIAIESLRDNFNKRSDTLKKLVKCIYQRSCSERIYFNYAVELYCAITRIQKSEIKRFLITNGYIDDNWNSIQDSFSFKEIACVSRGHYGHKAFLDFMLTKASIYGINTDIHDCTECKIPMCNFNKNLLMVNKNVKEKLR